MSNCETPKAENLKTENRDQNLKSKITSRLFRNFTLLTLNFIAASLLSTNASAAINARLLKEAGLQIAWQKLVALNINEKVESMTVLGSNVYVQTNSNYLFCLDRNDGRQVFALPAAEPRLPVSQPADFNNIVYFMSANHLLAIDLRSGAELFRKKIRYPATARPAITRQYFYLIGNDKQLHVADSNMFDIFKVDADDMSQITSVISNSDSIFFATETGKVYCMDANKPVKRWQFDTAGPIDAALAKSSDAVYVSGRDTNLYKLDAQKGKLLWKFYTGSFLNSSARPTGKVVYQYAINKGVYAIDANSGKQIWLSADGADLLAEDANTAYIISKKNICEIMDNITAKKIYTINFDAVTAFATNLYDNKMYVMEDSKILCLEPIRK